MANIPNLDFKDRTKDVLEILDIKEMDQETAEQIKEIFEQKLRQEFEEFDNELRKEGKRLIKNGTYPKRIVFGDKQFIVNCPRDRENLFKSKMFCKYLCATAETIKTIISLLGSMSIRKIADYFKERGLRIGRQFITKVYNHYANAMKLKYESSSIPTEVDQIIVDGTYSKVSYFMHNNEFYPRTIKSVCILQAYGINFKTKEKIDLGFKIVDKEDEFNYTEFFQDIYDKGLKNFNVLTSDHHPAIIKGARNVFGDGFKYQKCFIHTKRQLANKAFGWDKKMIEYEFSKIKYTSTQEEAQKIIYDIANKLRFKNKAIVNNIFHSKWTHYTQI